MKLKELISEVKIEKTKCFNCEHCIPLTNGEGICSYSPEDKNKKLIKMFDIYWEGKKKEKINCSKEEKV